MKKFLFAFAVLLLSLLGDRAYAQGCFGPACGTGSSGGGSGTGGGAAGTIHSKGGTLITPTGAADIVVWRAPFTCSVTKIQSLMVGGTSGTVNARKNGTTAFLAANLAITAGTWATSTTIQNASVAVDDYLEIQIVTVVGSPSTITVQIDCTV